MKNYIVRLMPEAESDLLRIYTYISEKSASQEVGRRYVDRITGFLASFETFPERGTVRSDIRDGLRIIGFDNRVSVAFLVKGDSVIVLRITYGGQQVEFGEH